MCVLENESLDFTMQKDSLHALVRLQLSKCNSYILTYKSQVWHTDSGEYD